MKYFSLILMLFYLFCVAVTVVRLIDDCGVSMYCDMHAHSRRHNIFIYGCENKRNPEKKLTEQVFPLMLHKNVADKVSSVASVCVCVLSFVLQVLSK